MMTPAPAPRTTRNVMRMGFMVFVGVACSYASGDGVSVVSTNLIMALEDVTRSCFS